VTNVLRDMGSRGAMVTACGHPKGDAPIKLRVVLLLEEPKLGPSVFFLSNLMARPTMDVLLMIQMANTGVPPKQTPMVFTWAVRVCGVIAVRSAEKSTPAKTSQSIIKSELQRAYFHF